MKHCSALCTLVQWHASSVHLQLNHYQYIFLLRVIDYVHMMIERIGADARHFAPPPPPKTPKSDGGTIVEQSPTTTTCALTISRQPHVTVNLLLPTQGMWRAHLNCYRRICACSSAQFVPTATVASTVDIVQRWTRLEADRCSVAVTDGR